MLAVVATGLVVVIADTAVTTFVLPAGRRHHRRPAATCEVGYAIWSAIAGFLLCLILRCAW